MDSWLTRKEKKTEKTSCSHGYALFWFWKTSPRERFCSGSVCAQTGTSKISSPKPYAKIALTNTKFKFQEDPALSKIKS